MLLAKLKKVNQMPQIKEGKEEGQKSVSASKGQLSGCRF
jgi:hypothetical protein